MGREVRRVPPDWDHPKNPDGFHRPLYDGFLEAQRQFGEDLLMWNRGFRRGYGDEKWLPKEEKHRKYSFEDWHGRRPDQGDYIPDWPDEIRTHIQMYETCSEGTPISPVMETPEERARWLADNDASASGSRTATDEQWLATCRQGFAVSMVMDAEHGMRSGVEATADSHQEER